VLANAANGDSLAVLFDPFGVRALIQLTRYFTSSQANTQLPTLSGLLLANRVIWSTVALCLFAATVAFFKPQRAGAARRRFGKAHQPAHTERSVPAPQVRPISPRFTARGAIGQCWQLLRFETSGVLRSLPFVIMLLLAIANFFANYMIGGARFDSTPYPLTRLMLEEVAGGINAMLVIVLLFYSGELVARERQLKAADIVDAMPVPDWMPLTAKAGVLVAVVLAFLATGTLAGAALQLAKGGAPFEPLLYLHGTLVNAARFIPMAFALLALHAIANNKYVGYLLGLALVWSDTLLGNLDLTHRLLNFAALPPVEYSDINGYGHFLTGWGWFLLYWTMLSLAMLLLAQALRVRGPAPGLLPRIATAARRLNGRRGLALAVCVAAFGATGGWIFYNTNVLNKYESPAAALDARADYEKQYRRYLDQPNPSITAVQADVDIFPRERRVAIHGSYQLRNKSSQQIDSLRFQLDTRASTVIAKLPPHTVALDDKALGFRIIKLREPLPPGATMAFDFTVEVRHPGFTNDNEPDGINQNGTMFTSEDYFPKLGYVQAKEIVDRAERRKRGLGEPHRMPALDHQQARSSNFWKLYGFDADQTAIAPGNLVASWQNNGRRYFRYAANKPILPFFSFQSARWDVRMADWHGVPIEVYYDHKHPYNIDSMVRGSQRALDYYTRNFGPYPHRQLRITEFPLYQQYARAFPNTIPFSESLGFINDVRDPKGVDHVFYVTAHEVAHQWWGEQLIPANTQGSGMLVESLAEYAALMTLEHEFGAEKTRHILRFDLDQYLAGRGKELVEEQPLTRVEGQSYIAYRKGSLVFYRLREELGEDVLNGVLKKFLDQHRYQARPYVTSADLLAAIRAVAPADKQELITDLFERIVLYDNRVLAAQASKRADGKWDVTMRVRLAKMQADGKGKETPRAYDEPVDVAVYGPRQEVLYRAKRQLAAGESTVTLTVDQQPAEARVDPDNLLLDRVPGDNRKTVRLP
jgi:hypothetical protein